MFWHFQSVFICVHTNDCVVVLLDFLRFGMGHVHSCFLCFFAVVLLIDSLFFWPNLTCLLIFDVLQILVGATSSFLVRSSVFCLRFYMSYASMLSVLFVFIICWFC